MDCVVRGRRFSNLVRSFPVKERWRNRHYTANVIQTTADHIDDHNWQYSPTGLIWTSHVTD